MKPAIFICYRRSDSSGAAGRIHDRLSAEFGADRVFMDVSDIAAGVDFQEAVQQRIERAAAVIAIIGPHWATDPRATGELDVATGPDYVRMEIATALKAGVRVIPVLIDDAKMPAQSALPPKLKKLSTINALEIRHTMFESDIVKLVDLLKDLRPKRHWAITASAGVGIVVAGMLGWQTLFKPSAPITTWQAETNPTAPTVGEPLIIEVRQRDAAGDVIRSLEGVFTLSVTGSNEQSPEHSFQDGVLRATYIPDQSGRDSLFVILNGDTVPGSPFVTSIQPAPTEQRGEEAPTATASVEFDARAVATYSILSDGEVLASGRVTGPTLVQNLPIDRQLTLRLVWDLPSGCSEQWETDTTLTASQIFRIPTKVNCSP